MASVTIVKKLQKKGKPVTAKELGVTTVRLAVLEKEGLIVRSGKRSTGKRGRPAFLFTATDPGDEAKAKRRYAARQRTQAKKS